MYLLDSTCFLANPAFIFTMQQTHGPYWNVPTGRRDGFRSVKDEALNNLPPPFFDATRNLNQFFVPKGLDAKDQVVLLGIYYSSGTKLNA